MNTIVIIDDVQQDREKIEKALMQRNIADDIQSFSTWNDSILALNAAIYFLDIEIGQINGFQVASIIKSKSPEARIVFCTNHNNLVFHSFAFDVFGFVRKDHLEEDLDRTLLKYNQSNSSIYKTNKYQIPLIKILYFESAHNYLNIHLTDHSILKERKTLRQLDTTSLHTFAKISSSFVVNMKYIDTIQQDKITLFTQETLYVSRNYKKEFLRAYAEYLMEN